MGDQWAFAFTLLPGSRLLVAGKTSGGLRHVSLIMPAIKDPEGPKRPGSRRLRSRDPLFLAATARTALATEAELAQEQARRDETRRNDDQTPRQDRGPGAGRHGWSFGILQSPRRS